MATPLTSVDLPSTGDVAAAAARIRPYARRTPMMRIDIDGRPVLLKLEHLQLSGSFKLRGGLNALLSDGGGPVVAASGGNHGLGVSMAAARLRREAFIFTPSTAPESKLARIEATGARLSRVGATYSEAAAAAREHSERFGHRYVDAYDDAAVVCGQGTVGLEIVEEVPEVDAVVVAAGGGGLASGVSLAVGDRRVVVVEPDGCCAVHRALEAGGPVDSPVDSIAASALGATRMGAIPYAVLAPRSPISALVGDAQLLAARDRLWEEFRLAVEPAAAAPLAALLAGHVPGELPCLVLCGANSSWSPQA